MVSLQGRRSKDGFFAGTKEQGWFLCRDEGARMVSLQGRRSKDGFPVRVTSLGVPMSPGLVNERMWALIAHGLISTERNTLP
jgi:hypothetical protein